MVKLACLKYTVTVYDPDPWKYNTAPRDPTLRGKPEPKSF